MNKDWKQDTVTVNDGIELFYTRTGGDKPTLILAHGITDSGLCWHQLASDLEEDYDLIMYDAYGHGKSSRIDPDKPLDLSENLHDLIKALKLDKPGVIGHSMGAATAASFAAAYPDMLSLLVLEDPPWSDAEMDPKEGKKMLQDWKKNNLSAKEKTVKDLIKLKRKESPNWEEAILKEWAQSKLDVDPAFFDRDPIKREEWRALAKAITVPTLIVTGDNNLGAIVTPELGVEAVQILEKGEFGHISAAGHCVRYEQYQPYLTMVKLFLQRNMPK
ncbi:MAG: alpha/beta hydrolase [Chloroflexota bacterium]|jgi:pimeloyl-ACP methyl ester carboxylesterase|nr:alpha/beta hydrolase [Chloroflexota bacterium]